MGYRDNVALDYEALSPERQARVAPRLRPAFGVVEGGGLDASVRRGVTNSHREGAEAQERTVRA